jgi:hypothetical protein
MGFVYVGSNALSKAIKFRSDEAQTQQNILLGRQFCFLY